MDADRRTGGERSLYVRKVRIPGLTSQPNGDPRDGWFMLAAHLGPSNRPETLLELLNSRRVVVPFIQARLPDVLMLTRVNIDWVIVEPRVDQNLIYPPNCRVTVEHRVDLRLLDERRIHAILRWDDRGGTARLSDFLNGSDDFIAAKTRFGLLLVNRLRIRETQLAEVTARPVDDDVYHEERPTHEG